MKKILLTLTMVLLLLLSCGSSDTTNVSYNLTTPSLIEPLANDCYLSQTSGVYSLYLQLDTDLFSEVYATIQLYSLTDNPTEIIDVTIYPFNTFPYDSDGDTMADSWVGQIVNLSLPPITGLYCEALIVDYNSP